MTLPSRERTNRILLAIAFPMILFAPFFPALKEGRTLETLIEESFGYRYFYSLRILFGHEGPWIPQGHTVGILHHLFNLILSLAGLPQSDLELRPFLFIWGCALIGLIAVGLAFYFALTAFRSFAARAFFFVLLIGGFMSSALPFYWYILPDYQIWIAVLALMTLAWAGRMMPQQDEATLGQAIRIAAFGGLAVGIKASCAVYPLTLALIWLWKAPRRTAQIGLATMPPIGLLVFSIVLFVFYLGKFKALLYWPTGFWIFVKSQANTLGSVQSSFLGFCARLIDPSAGKMLWLTPLGLIVVGLIGIRGDRRVLPVVPGLLAIIWFQYVRDYQYTAIETVLFGTFAIGFAVAVLQPPVSPASAGNFAREVAIGALAVTAVVLAVPRFNSVAGSVKIFGEVERDYRKFKQEIAAWPGPEMVLAPGNRYRVSAMESALCKGGTDIYNARWGASPYVAELFPNYACAVLGEPVNLSGFSTVLFIVLDDIDTTKQRIEKYFSTSLEPFDCQIRLRYYTFGEYVACLRRGA